MQNALIRETGIFIRKVLPFIRGKRKISVQNELIRKVWPFIRNKRKNIRTKHAYPHNPYFVREIGNFSRTKQRSLPSFLSK